MKKRCLPTAQKVIDKQMKRLDGEQRPFWRAHAAQKLQINRKARWRAHACWAESNFSPKYNKKKTKQTNVRSLIS